MIVGVPKETTPGERRVALVPELIAPLKKAGLDVAMQIDAGTAAGYLDAAFHDKGARASPSVIADADVVLKVQPPTSDEIAQFKEGAVYIGFLQPYTEIDTIPA